VDTGNPSACSTGTVNCGIVKALYVSVIKTGCNRSANTIQSSELEPVIYVICTTLHVTILYEINDTLMQPDV
jgi:hypothetical protein